MDTIETVLARNRTWADRARRSDPAYFERLLYQQAPQFLWIGCSDSRVAANVIMDLPHGEVFVHRNIANVVSPSDLNCLSVLQYAVEVLRVSAIIVCGHYGCGGVRASLSAKDHGLIDNWLNHIRLVGRLHAAELEPLSAPVRENRLCELNVVEQVRNVVATTVVQTAWSQRQPLAVYGLVYSLADGILKELVRADTPGRIR